MFKSWVISILSFIFPATTAQLAPTAFGIGNQVGIDTQAFYQARQQIAAQEGTRMDAYYDSQGVLTVGIGHKVVASDHIVYKQVITTAQRDAFFNVDVQKAFDAARDQALELNKYDIFLIAALTSVNFQLGTGWRRKFPNTWTALKSGNIVDAIKRLKTSSWYQQTPNRVASFINVLQEVYA